MHNISVLNDIVLSFDTQFAGSTALCFASKLDEIGVFDYFCTDEASLEIGMDDSGALRCFHTLAEGPCAHFVRSGSKERTELQQRVCGFDKSRNICRSS